VSLQHSISNKDQVGLLVVHRGVGAKSVINGCLL